MTPTQRAAIVEDLEDLIAKHRDMPTSDPYRGDPRTHVAKDPVLIACNATVIRLAESVLVLLPDADRPDDD